MVVHHMKDVKILKLQRGRKIPLAVQDLEIMPEDPTPGS